MKRVMLLSVLFLGLLLPPMFAFAEYPERPVTVISPFPAGGVTDLVARAFVDGIKKKFPKGIAVVNRPGGGGSIGVCEVVGAKADGHTLGLVTLPSLVVLPQINVLPYKTPDDCEPIINLVSCYQLLAVHADAPWKTSQEFISAVRANPGKIRVGSSGIGSASHLNLEELGSAAKIDMNHVPFSGWAELSVALLGKHVDAVIVNPHDCRGLIDANQIRILAAFGPTRSPYYPNVPTWKEIGYDAAIPLWWLVIAPKGTPTTVVQFIHDAAKTAMNESGFVKFVKSLEIEIDYRGVQKLREDLWQAYRKHTDILTRLGLRKQ